MPESKKVFRVVPIRPLVTTRRALLIPTSIVWPHDDFRRYATCAVPLDWFEADHLSDLYENYQRRVLQREEVEVEETPLPLDWGV